MNKTVREGQKRPILRVRTPLTAEKAAPIAERNSKQIAKGNQKQSALKSLYSALQVVTTRRRTKGECEGVNEAIDKFLDHLNKCSAEIVKTQLGSRGIQLCLKHGASRHRNQILLSIIKNDVLRVMSSKYGAFLFSRLFRYCKGESSYSLLEDFVKGNMAAIIALKDGLLILGAYSDSLNQREQTEFLFGKLPKIELPDFFFEEFLAEKIYQRRYLINSACHSLLLHNANRIKDKGEDLIENLSEAFHICARRTATLAPIIALICRLYFGAKWSPRKKVLKEIFGKKFIEYFKRDTTLIYLIFALLSTSQNKRILDLTFTARLSESVSNIIADPFALKLFQCLIAEPNVIFQDSLLQSAVILPLIPLFPSKIESETFCENRKYIAETIFLSENFTFEFKYEKIVSFCVEKNGFSIFCGALIEWLIKSKDSAKQIEHFFGELFINAARESQSVSPKSGEGAPFFASSVGHRLYKKAIQTLKHATEENKAIAERHIRSFFHAIEPNLYALLQTKAVFILVAIIEHSEMGEILRFSLKKLTFPPQTLSFAGVKLLKSLL